MTLEMLCRKRGMASIFGSWRAEHASDDVELFADVGGIRFAKLVRMAAATISAERAGLEAFAKGMTHRNRPNRS